MNEKRQRFGSLLLGYFLRGLLLLVPITITIWALIQVFSFLDGIIKTDFPGLGLVLLLFIITAAGAIGSSLLFQPLAAIAEEWLQRIPFLKTLYSVLKDMVEAVVGNKKKFDRPVLVKLTEGIDARHVGFITQEDLSHIGLDQSHVAVYLPHAFAWSGNLVIVPAVNVTPLHARAADVMKFAVSGGVSQVDDEA
jgi:uncharacterized membrane protein